MDARRFDAIARSLPATGSRRQALVAVLGGVLASALEASSPEEAEAKKKCPPCRKRKNGKCKKKPDGTVCPGGTCQSGRCAQAIPCPCPSGQTCMGNGSCGLACTATGQCPGVEGQFQCGCAYADAQGQRFCTVPFKKCTDYPQTCSSDSDCPPDEGCLACANPTDFRCLALCTSP
jgi:hypothetical protein